MAAYAETKLAPLRSLAIGTLDLALVLKGVAEFLLRGENSDAAFHSMLRLHCRTNGRSTRILTNALRRVNGKKPLTLVPESESYFSAIPASDRSALAAEIHRQGYCVLPVRLSEAACAELADFSKKTPAEAIDTRAEVLCETLFNHRDPRVVRFKYKSNDLVRNPIVQRLISDPVLIAIARSYFAAPPLVDSVTMWWSLGKGAAPSSDLAQLYHFDFDRTKWLKVFFYLNDVDANGGPHTYVRGSHLPEQRKARFLERGYVRIPDHEIEAAYSKEAVVEIAGKKGTVFFEDTSGFHKGKAPTTGDRLLFEIQFCVSRFGARYQPIALPEEREPFFDSFRRRHPWLYPLFDRQ